MTREIPDGSKNTKKKIVTSSSGEEGVNKPKEKWRRPTEGASNNGGAGTNNVLPLKRR